MKYIMMVALICLVTVFACTPLTKTENAGIAERLEKLANTGELIVQLAELQIDSAQLDVYLELLRKGQRTSIALEPGVLTMYSLANKNDPTRLTIVEVYENKAAYAAHLASAHFEKYKQETLSMVDSLTLTRMDPIVFAAQPN